MTSTRRSTPSRRRWMDIAPSCRCSMGWRISSASTNDSARPTCWEGPARSASIARERRRDTPRRCVASDRLRRSRAASGPGRGRMLADAFAKTTVEWELADDIEQNMWEKITFLSVLAATNCLFRANIGETVGAPEGLAAIERALAVNFEIATREGHPPRPAAIEFARKRSRIPRATQRVDAQRSRGGESGRERSHRGVDARQGAGARARRHDPFARVHAPQGVRSSTGEPQTSRKSGVVVRPRWRASTRAARLTRPPPALEVTWFRRSAARRSRSHC